MKKFLLIMLVLLFSAPTLLLAKSTAEGLLKNKWYKATTPHFTIITDSSKKKARQLSENLERFRIAFQIVTGTELPSRSRKIKVIATRKKKNFQSLAVTERLKKTGGFFIDSVNGNYTLVNLGWHNSMTTLFHEYTHYLHAHMKTANSPKWFREGIAQHIASIEFKGDRTINMGKAYLSHLQYLNAEKWLPTEEMLSTATLSFDNKKRVRKFYAQSWLMVHFFYSKDSSLQGVDKYLRLVSIGTPVPAALEEAFGLTVETLTEELETYATRTLRYSKIVLTKPIDIEGIHVETLSYDDAGFELGDFMLQAMSAWKPAEEMFELSLAFNESNANSLAGLANLYMGRDIDRAAQLVERAKELSADNSWVATISGHINGLRYRSAENATEKIEYWNRAITDYNLAIGGKGTVIEALSSVAELYASKNNWEKYDQVVGAAMTLAPSNQVVRYKGIVANIKMGRHDSAEYIAGLIRNNTHMTPGQLSRFETWYSKQLEK
jgi:tetratricopeptide (TPR) repeat protein